MRKIIVSEMVTLDGFFSGPAGEIDWHVVDEQFNEYAIALLDRIDLMLYGRLTYELMAGYWPSPDGLRDDPIIAGKMNATPKVVFSRTLHKADWSNARLVKDNLVQEVARLKQQPGKDIVIYGSGSLVSTLTQHRLIDEYMIIVAPVILGSGKTLFQGVTDRVHLKLLDSRSFRCGDVLMIYQPANE